MVALRSMVARRIRLTFTVVFAVGLLPFASVSSEASTRMPPTPHSAVVIYDDRLDPVDVQVGIGDSVEWQNSSLLPRQIVEEDLDAFRSSVLMPSSDLTSPGTDKYVYTTQFAGTFDYRADTAPIAVSHDEVVPRGTVTVWPRMSGYRYIEGVGLKILLQWAAGYHDGWTHDVDYGVFDYIPSEDPADWTWTTWFRDADHSGDWLPFDCDERWYFVRARVRAPNGSVSGWSPPSGTWCHQDPPPPPAD